MRVVDRRVEERGVVGGPRRAVVRPVDRVGQQLAGDKVLEPHRERLVTVVVGREREHAWSGLTSTAPSAKNGESPASSLPSSSTALVRLVVGRRPPAEDRVLLALLGAGHVPPGAAFARNGEVGLLHARLDLVEQAVAQRGRGARSALGVRVLGFEIRDRVGIVAVEQPVVVVDGLVRRARPHVRLAWRDRSARTSPSP